jgi:hypothetical protein
MRFLTCCFLLIVCVTAGAFAQQDTTPRKTYRRIQISGNSLLDSVANAMQARKAFCGRFRCHALHP